MGMFIVEKGVKAKAIKAGVEWLGDFKDIVTTKTCVFNKEELVIDPTGIAPWACTSRDFITVGGLYAKNGWYGFLQNGWYLLIPGHNVIYG